MPEQELKLSTYYVLYMDILGVKDKINSDNSEDFLKELNSLYQEVLKGINLVGKEINNIKIETKIFSDNIIIAINKDNNIELCAMKLMLIFEIAAMFQVCALAYNFLVRGSLVSGDLYIDGTFVYGKALLDAYNLETNIAVYPRIIIKKEDVAEFMQCDSLIGYIGKDSSGISYINSFDKYFEIVKKDITKEDVKTLSDNLKKKKSEMVDYRYYSKIYWLINEFNNFCERKIFKDCRINFP